ncbi:neuronal acetylcholine receptor subunit beta-3-like isoform X2 [Mercenaria mercenaria]|uniref:neuronal acetylcholine receptor subunit beta-3-like isoform X2 n=1 Tax=Mercenaria mercenaria TaxID=6596 RepID=UPI00234F4AF2|nr:neuronal acetylcholine receptor subunit beta-3-like isoform X2 [Mercenaria mercenaria]
MKKKNPNLFDNINLHYFGVISYSTSSAGSLYTALTFGYNNLVRPSGTTAVTVSFGILSVNHLSWTDGRFSWTPSSYSGITEMYLDYTYCWNPKIIIDNSIDDASILADGALLFQIDSSGVVTWSPSEEFTVHCSMDVTFYPYDTQTCFLSVKSWSFPATAVELISGGIYSNQYAENDEWELTSSSVTTQNVTTNGIQYSNLLYKFTMTRRSTTILLTVVLPFVLASFLGVFVFMIPAESSNKTGFPVGVLVVEVVLLSIMMEVIPISARNVPVLGTYALVLVIFSLCETFMTIIIIKLYHNKDRNKRVTYIYERLAIVVFALTCFWHGENRSGNSASPTTECESTSIESPHVNETPPEFKNSIKRRLSIKTISPDCSFATSSKEEFERSGRRSRAWDGGGALCGGGVEQKFTWEQFSSAVDRFCFFMFMLLRLILAIIFMTMISVGSS